MQAAPDSYETKQPFASPWFSLFNQRRWHHVSSVQAISVAKMYSDDLGSEKIIFIDSEKPWSFKR